MGPCAWSDICGNAAITKVLHPLMGPTNVCFTCGVKVLQLCENLLTPPINWPRQIAIQLVNSSERV